MEADSLVEQVRLRLGLRVTPETARYVESSLATRPKSSVFVLAADARTGVAVRAQVDPKLLDVQAAAPEPAEVASVKPAKPNEQLMLF